MLPDHFDRRSGLYDDRSAASDGIPGFDAFFHAAEGYLAKTASPMSDMFALQAITLIGKSLATAVKDGGNADARADVALANTLAGFVETLSSCSGEHAIEHALSAFHPDLPHGAGLIMLSKAYWSRFKDTSADRLQAIAHALGRADGDFLAALAELQQACGVDKLRLSDYGVKPEDAGELADNAASTMAPCSVSIRARCPARRLWTSSPKAFKRIR